MKQKLLFLNGHLNVGGVEKSLVDLLRHLDYDQYEADLLLFEGLGDYAPDLPEQVNVRLVDLSRVFGSLPKVLLNCLIRRDWFSLRLRLILQWCGQDVRQLSLARSLLFQDKEYDVVIGFRPGFCTNIAAFAAPGKRKVTWWHHGAYNLSPEEAAVYRLACGEMDRVVSVSETCCTFLKEHLPELEKKLTVIPNRVPVEDIRQKAAARLPYAKEPGWLYLVSVGRLTPEKHMENALFAGKILVEQGIQTFKWYIVGDGPERSRLESLCREQGLENHFTFAGRKSNPYPYMKQADLFVHPSYVESQGLVVLEALALGVPCVVTKSLGPCEFIEDGVNGLLTEQSPESLAEKVLKILSDKELHQRIKANTRCPEGFRPEQVMEQVHRLLEE